MAEPGARRAGLAGSATTRWRCAVWRVRDLLEGNETSSLDPRSSPFPQSSAHAIRLLRNAICFAACRGPSVTCVLCRVCGSLARCMLPALNPARGLSPWPPAIPAVTGPEKQVKVSVSTRQGHGGNPFLLGQSFGCVARPGCVDSSAGDGTQTTLNS